MSQYYDKSLMESSNVYDEEYYERGSIRGISGYMNYTWLPELTLRMAHHMIVQLGLKNNQKVLDFGCAKGYLVKALRILDINAFGVDVSEYAINNRPADVMRYCKRIEGVEDPACFESEYDWLIAKDVFEHLTEDVLRTLLIKGKATIKKMFLAIPLGKDDEGSGFLIPEYDKDITHTTARTFEWWKKLFEECGWKVEESAFKFNGIKENWTKVHPYGNGFFIISSTIKFDK